MSSKRPGSISRIDSFRRAAASGRAAWRRLDQFWAYVRVGVLNAAFGYGVYALLLLAGVNLFAAQIIAHLLGMGFNYFMFRRHVFRDSRAAVGPYIVAYAVNYGLSLATLAGLNRILASDYLAGFLSVVFVALVNFVVLKFLVFLPRSAAR